MAAIRMLARAQLRRSLRTLILLGVLAGVTAGIVLGSAQLARRTSTAHARLEQAAAAPDAVLQVVAGPEIVPQLLELPEVEAALVAATGIATVGGNDKQFIGVFALPEDRPPDLFRPIVVDGRLPDPSRPDEMVVSEELAKVRDVDVGTVVPLAFLTTEEFGQFDTGFGEPDGPTVDMKIVGTVRTATDRGINAIEAYSTPALAELIADGGSDSYPTIFVKLRDGTADLPEFTRKARAIGDAAPPVPGAEEFDGVEVQEPSRQRDVIAVTARVLTIGLLTFAGVAGIAGLLGVALVMRRHFHATVDPDLPALGAVGVTSRQVRAARLLTAVPFVVVGTVVALALAVALGVLEPLGSLASEEPYPGWHVNLTVLAIALPVVVGLLGLVALVSGPTRLRRPAPPLRTNAVAARLATAGAPPTTVVGTRMALQPGRGRTAVPVRSTSVATTLAILGVVAVIVFVASLDRLVDSPERWGWMADAEVVDTQDELTARLEADPQVTAVSEYDEAPVQVEDRVVVGESFATPSPAVGWTIIDGSAPAGTNEIVLGSRLARDLGRGLGDTVDLRREGGGTATFTVIGVGAGPNLNNQQFAGGVLLRDEDLARFARAQPFTGAAVKLRDGDTARFERRYGDEAELSFAERPPDVDNLAQLGALPWLLALFLVLVGVVVLGNFLLTTVRRRRRDLDTLRAMGFVPRQVHALVATVALVTVGVGLVIGVPLGIAAGRLGWQLTARSVYVATGALVPLAALAAFVGVAIVASLLVAVWPAWRAARDPAARGLRDE
jgi:ABC-type lipoprotein release transport system permease subunit